MVTIAIQQVVLMIFDAPQTIRLFPIDSNVIGPNRGENEFNLTLLLEFIIYFFFRKVEKKAVRKPSMSHKSRETKLDPDSVRRAAGVEPIQKLINNRNL